MRAPLVVAVTAAALASLLFALRPVDAPGAGRSAAPPPPGAISTSAPADATPTRAPARPRASRIVYALEMQQRIRLGDGEPIEIGLLGTWTQTPRAGGHPEVRLQDAELSGADLPLGAAELDVPMRLRVENGGLRRVGFVAEPRPMAHRMLVTLAAATWYTAGEGARWTAVEADRAGRYEARYARQPDGAVVRTRDGYLALHGPEGRLHADGIEQISVTGESRFEIDARGVVTLAVDERITSAGGEGRPEVVAELEVRLTRLDVEGVALVAGPAMRFGPLKQRRAPMDVSRRLDQNRVGDATVPGLVSALSDASVADLEGPRRTALAMDADRLAAALRLDPSRAAAVASAVRAAGDNAAATALLTGGLAGAGHAEAAAALTTLFADDLAPMARTQALVGLARSGYADAGTVAAVEAQLDDPELGRTAQLALGAQANALRDGDPALADDTMDPLFDQYAEADDADAQRRVLDALANSGDARLVALVSEGLDDPRLAPTAAFALRFVPGAEADDLLAEILTTPRAPAVWQGAVGAIGFRDVEAWRTPLSLGLDEQAYDPATRQAIERLLARTAM